ncbi:MAG: hypothetical protein PHU71_06675 [Candidatus Gracilibacteria bacterium]|nr:hypothetical protein [Candidatus Gracilibacteria bacterium]
MILMRSSLWPGSFQVLRMRPYGELDGMRRDHDHFKGALVLKDKQICFLEGHVAQLTQIIRQLTLTTRPRGFNG